MSLLFNEKQAWQIDILAIQREQKTSAYTKLGCIWCYWGIFLIKMTRIENFTYF